MMERLEAWQESGRITEYTAYMLIEMSGQVLEHIARKHSKIRKEVQEVMGGQVLDHEAGRLLRKGKAEGRVEGRVEGDLSRQRRVAARMIRGGRVSMEDIAEYAELSLEEVERLAREMPEDQQGADAEDAL